MDEDDHLFLKSRGKDMVLEGIITYCRNSQDGYKVPRQFTVVDELPRNPSGKILKNVLREPYQNL